MYVCTPMYPKEVKISTPVMEKPDVVTISAEEYAVEGTSVWVPLTDKNSIRLSCQNHEYDILMKTLWIRSQRIIKKSRSASLLRQWKKSIYLPLPLKCPRVVVRGHILYAQIQLLSTLAGSGPSSAAHLLPQPLCCELNSPDSKSIPMTSHSQQPFLEGKPSPFGQTTC